ncbi:hypothetical protein FO488_11795 [Geobacter sp. FeAm09]|uniref:hypothetical protein n=1 Tax=Geobacter sp. FeAm09 TaxID=2597769 RepID=UPI0011EF08E1|nr:hypothetical protein [Geobacter sp. FeAm09]QEM68771.1 hypothetical protein FO488_11795 [Geobacter sp. FeAm09]
MGKHACTTWQGFLQQLITLISHGYRYYCLTEYPIKKQDKWETSDMKLIKKYDADIGKDKRYRNQQKGRANYTFLRWGKIALILRSAGEYEEAGDRFVDIREKDLVLEVGDTMRIRIVHEGSKGRVTAYLEKQVYRDIKAELLDHCRHRRLDVLKGRFAALNGLPGYSGITQQKAGLVTDIIREGKKHGVTLQRKDFPIRTSRKIYKVFD